MVQDLDVTHLCKCFREFTHSLFSANLVGGLYFLQKNLSPTYSLLHRVWL